MRIKIRSKLSKIWIENIFTKREIFIDSIQLKRVCNPSRLGEKNYTLMGLSTSNRIHKISYTSNHISVSFFHLNLPIYSIFM